MATFHQQEQNVGTQYNADTINFGQVKTQDEYIKALQQLQTDLEKAIESQQITGDKAIDAEGYVKKAIRQASAEKPDKKTLIEHLKSAKDIVTNVEGLAAAFTGAIAAIAAIF